METGVFHEDLLQEILIRLPAKSLVRFRCVCRSWYSLIASPSFISAQVVHKKKAKSYHVLLRSFNNTERKYKYKLCNDDEHLDEIMIIDFPFVSEHNDFFRIAGCVNGLVCLSDDIVEVTDTVIIWNPVIRRFLTLPKLELNVDSSELGRSVLGFGFDSYNNDYKVIRIVYRKNPDFEARQIEALIAIFRLSSSSWEVNRSASVPLLDTRQAYVNGSIHWLAYNKLMVGFDVESEELRDMTLPNSLKNANISDLTIASWCDMLSVFENGYWFGKLSLWVMKDYGDPNSWVKQFEIESFALVRSLRKNGCVILESIGGKLVLYNANTNQFEDFKTHVEGSVRGFHMKSYLESLVLLDRLDVYSIP
ncbi:F-box/kelch-repeat protein At3g06240-like [Amaranthus tricolor]|uniref:F-box/kelch-repeat protein At3g06240-like n=1 Tax=Amaranthus tricolor TaxID=29722 RepID=UPI00258F5A9A|nr:F-box/kelch-repeat protein At3g06240-like [Amaranthus tricolor]XP_057527744.1 F-box/kelch-repeat protein At3g06240-like [Amaranthus tricolor]XP_057527745.1 F-box/kelch-repeat protein At3g06240-like [Amaranthus tricolor]